ncbi:MAG: OmpA family protein [Chitinophagaceae bacterium]|nr:OmpA family protein [Chitinophagaceae bacterium]MBK8951300.1 OmpA family protein [Chitinophagaceae bacterium]
MYKRYAVAIIILLFVLLQVKLTAQTNLLLNGGFEEINTCTEYNAECGVEAWFYLKDVQAQMLSNETNQKLLGKNSFGIFYSWNYYRKFTPVIGTILSCGLQQNKKYVFKGLLSARINSKLNLRPGICLGDYFYVPNRHFSKNLLPDSITNIRSIPNSAFYSFEYIFTATGSEQYLTFGTFISEDTVAGKKTLAGTQTVALVLDNFELTPVDEKEIPCPASEENKNKIFAYNYRHKEMDYSLFGKGKLNIAFINYTDTNNKTTIKPVVLPIRTDTLKLDDVLFDFNKAELKASAISILFNYFLSNNQNKSIDSIYIEGHTDSIGSDKRNLLLSMQRCESVKNWMINNNIINTEKMYIRPYGKKRPVASNKTAEGRSLNRRVEIIIFRRKT